MVCFDCCAVAYRNTRKKRFKVCFSYVTTLMPIRLAGYVFTKELPFLQSKKSERGKKNTQQELFSTA